MTSNKIFDRLNIHDSVNNFEQFILQDILAQVTSKVKHNAFLYIWENITKPPFFPIASTLSQYDFTRPGEIIAIAN